jgi:hypothetical protein
MLHIHLQDPLQGGADQLLRMAFAVPPRVRAFEELRVDL